MNSEIKKFLDFNGTNINVLSVDGQYYVAIRPICKALGVDYHQQFKNLQADEDLVQLLCEHTTVAQDNKLRKMVCLPEEFIYGWLFSIKSPNPDFRKYKMKCYRILYNYFHGTTTERIQVLRTVSEDELLLKEAKKKYQADVQALDSLKEVNEIEARMKGSKIVLSINDKKLLAGQFKIFSE
jgi:hypothetical protein